VNSKPLDKFGENVLQQRERRRRRPYFPVPGEILFSDALKTVVRTPAPMVYLFIVTRQPYPPDAKQIARLKKARLWPPQPVEFSFPLREARYHGMTEKGLAKGLRELYRVGIIDIVRHGSAMRGDFSQFILSERWKLWDKPGFDDRPWPKTRFVPARGKDGTFIRHSRKESMKNLLDANTASIGPPVVVESATTAPLLVANIAVNTPTESALLVAKSAVIIDLLQGSEVEPKVQDSEGRSKKKVRPLNSRSNSTSAAIRDDDAPTSPKQWQPPLSEIRENVSEILRQCHDSRANDPKFVGQISGQLGEALAGRLDPERVNCDFQWKHGFDGWTTDLLFAVATINLNFMGVTN